VKQVLMRRVFSHHHSVTERVFVNLQIERRRRCCAANSSWRVTVTLTILDLVSRFNEERFKEESYVFRSGRVIPRARVS